MVNRPWYYLGPRIDSRRARFARWRWRNIWSRLRRRPPVRMDVAITSSGGFCAPRNTGVSFGLAAARITDLVNTPTFTSLRGGIDFREPHVKWAEARELELRREARMWDWP